MKRFLAENLNKCKAVDCKVNGYGVVSTSGSVPQLSVMRSCRICTAWVVVRCKYGEGGNGELCSVISRKIVDGYFWN